MQTIFSKISRTMERDYKEWKQGIVYINGQSVLTTKFEDFTGEIRQIEQSLKG